MRSLCGIATTARPRTATHNYAASCRGLCTGSRVYLGGIPLSRAPQIFRRNTRFALTGIRPDYQFLLLIFAAIWRSDFRDNLITLTRLFKQAKQIRIPFMAMVKVNSRHAILPASTARACAVTVATRAR